MSCLRRTDWFVAPVGAPGSSCASGDESVPGLGLVPVGSEVPVGSDVATEELAGKGFPQLLQNLAPGRLVNEQFGQEISSGLPQLSQNRTPGRFSAWQVGHVINSVFSLWINRKTKIAGGNPPSGRYYIIN